MSSMKSLLMNHIKCNRPVFHLLQKGLASNRLPSINALSYSTTGGSGKSSLNLKCGGGDFHSKLCEKFVIPSLSVTTRCFSSTLLSAVPHNGAQPGSRLYSSKAGSEKDHESGTGGKGRVKKDLILNIPWWGRLLIVSGIAGAVLYVIQDAEYSKKLEKEKVRYEEFNQVAQMGGDWTLTDQDGKKRSSTEFRGLWQLIYFGFTHCPDVCPEELQKLAAVIKMFDEAKNLPSLQPLFITLDPERDSPAAIKSYLTEFKCPRMVGFTGSEEEIKTVCKQYRVYAGKGARDEENDYIVDHTIIIYLVNPEGQFVNYYGQALSAEQVFESVSKHIKLYKDLK